MTGKGSAKKSLEFAKHLMCFTNLVSGSLSHPFSNVRAQFLQGHIISCLTGNLWFYVQNADPS